MRRTLYKSAHSIQALAAQRLRVASQTPAVALASAQFSTKSSPSNSDSTPSSAQPSQTEAKDSGITKTKKKTMAELDEELRSKLEAMSGDGGASGVEYENGRAEGLKRGVKSNMFRVI